VHTVRNVSLPPNAQTIFAVKAKTQLSAGVYEIEQHARMPNQQILLAHSIAQPKNKRMVCCVWNPTDKIIRFRERTPIGTLASVEVVEPNETEPPPLPSPKPSVALMRQEFEHSKKISLESTALEGENLDKLVTLLYQYRDLFVTSLDELPQEGANVQPFSIDTQGALPYGARRLRHTPEQRREIERQVNQMLDAKIITPTSSSWNSNVVLIRKRNRFRFCADLCHLNSVSRLESFPLPTFSEVCDSISDSHSFLYSTLDLKAGY
jgi:hypothetical protein